MTTAKAEHCFPALKRMKAFLRNAMSQEQLNALTMLSIEKKDSQQVWEILVRNNRQVCE